MTSVIQYFTLDLIRTTTVPEGVGQKNTETKIISKYKNEIYLLDSHI